MNLKAILRVTGVLLGVAIACFALSLFVLAGCGAIDNDRLLAAALLMQGQANAMARSNEAGPVTCVPFGEGISCRRW